MSTRTATKPAPTYDDDFYAWTQDQAEKLRSARPNSLDWENVAEELESLGRSDRAEVQSRLEILITHLLKWRHQPDWRSKSWLFTIKVQRRDIARKLKLSPSLRGFTEDSIIEVYEDAVEIAARETGFFRDSFPASCPFSPSEVLDPEYLPEDLD